MRRKLPGILIALVFATICFSLPVYAMGNTDKTADKIEAGQTVHYRFFDREYDDEDEDWEYDYRHYYKFTPSVTQYYTITLRGSCLNQDSAMYFPDDELDSAEYHNGKLEITDKMFSGRTYLIVVDLEDNLPASPQDIELSVTKHTHHMVTKSKTKCKINSIDEDDLTINDSYDGYIEQECDICGYETEDYYTAPEYISASKLYFVANGKVQQPKIKIWYDKKHKKAFSNYKVTLPKSKKIGNYNATITFTGNYTGKIKVPYSIGPGKTSGIKIKAKKRGFSASWKKTKDASGYNLYFSWDKEFWVWSTAQKSTAKTKMSVKTNYQKGTTLYVVVQPYSKSSTGKVYGPVSKIFKVKIK